MHDSAIVCAFLGEFFRCNGTKGGVDVVLSFHPIVINPTLTSVQFVGNTLQGTEGSSRFHDFMVGVCSHLVNNRNSLTDSNYESQRGKLIGIVLYMKNNEEKMRK